MGGGKAWILLNISIFSSCCYMVSMVIIMDGSWTLLHHLSRGFLLSHSGLLYISVPTGYTLPREDLISIMTYTPSLPLAILIHFPFFYFFWPHLPEDRQPYWHSYLLCFLSALWPGSDIKDCRVSYTWRKHVQMLSSY